MNKGFPKSVNFYKVIAHSYEVFISSLPAIKNI